MRRGMSWATLPLVAAHASPSSNKVLWWWTRTSSVTGAVFTGSLKFWGIRCIMLARLSHCDAALLVLLRSATCILRIIISSCKHLYCHVSVVTVTVCPSLPLLSAKHRHTSDMCASIPEFLYKKNARSCMKNPQLLSGMSLLTRWGRGWGQTCPLAASCINMVSCLQSEVP